MKLFDRYAFFTSAGRANRRTFWFSVLWIVLAFALGITTATLFGDNGVYDDSVLARPYRLALVILALAPILVLSIRFRGICVRRRRDCRMSGHLHAVRWIPFVGRYAHLGALGFLPSKDDPLEAAVRVFDAPGATPVGAGVERREPRF